MIKNRRKKRDPIEIKFSENGYIEIQLKLELELILNLKIRSIPIGELKLSKRDSKRVSKKNKHREVIKGIK